MGMLIRMFSICNTYLRTYSY